MNIKIVEETCCTCGSSFWISKDHQKKLIDSEESFYCPNGHGQNYNNSQKDELREKIKFRDRKIKELENFLKENKKP